MKHGKNGTVLKTNSSISTSTDTDTGIDTPLV